MIWCIFEDEDVSISSVSSCLYKCLRIAQWFDGMGEEADEMFLERSGSSFMSQDWAGDRAGGFLSWSY